MTENKGDKKRQRYMAEQRTEQISKRLGVGLRGKKGKRCLPNVGRVDLLELREVDDDLRAEEGREETRQVRGEEGRAAEQRG